MKILRFLAGNSLAFLVILGALDLFLQVSGTSLPAFVEYHQRFGRLFKPGAELLMLNEGFFIGKVNPYAYPGPAYAPDKPVGTLRVALLGDSYVEGFQVFDRHHMRSYLERTLNQNMPESAWQVQNFGFSGFNLARMFFYYREFVAPFSPDVSLFFVSDEDFSAPDISEGPRFSVQAESLYVDISGCLPATGSLQDRLAFLRNLGIHSLLQKSRHLLQNGKVSGILFGKLAGLFAATPAAIAAASQDTTPGPRVAINREVLRLVSQTNQRSGKFVFVVKEPLSADNERLIRNAGVTQWELQEVFDNLKSMGVDPHYWKATRTHGHWNHAAHEEIGRFLGQKLKANGHLISSGPARF